MASQSVWFTVACVFVAFVGVFGIGVMFTRATNIDRNALVGTLTFVTAAISAAILYFSRNVTNMSSIAILMVSLFSLTGFFLGRVIDRAMGGTELSDDARISTLGSDLSD